MDIRDIPSALGAPLALCTALALALSAPGADAYQPSAEQSAGPQDSDDIIVRGQQQTPAERRAEIVDYVRRTGVANGQVVVARWVDPICPRVLGLIPEHGAIVVARVRAIANSVGAPLAAEDCDPNLSIVFSEDGRETISTIRRRRWSQFAEVPHGERDDLYESTLPIRWWYRTEERPSVGGQHTNGQPVFVSVEGTTMGDRLGNGNVMQQYSASQISTRTMRAIRSASVVIDVNEAHGYTLDSVSTYAAMVALAEMRMGTQGHGDSILGLFESPDRGDDLSTRDATFLTELYSLPMDRPARVQRSLLVRALLNEEGDEATDEG